MNITLMTMMIDIVHERYISYLDAIHATIQPVNI
jgi:hypothetical protein